MMAFNILKSLIIITTIVSCLLDFVYNEPVIDPISIEYYKINIPNEPIDIDYISQIGDGCILYDLYCINDDIIPKTDLNELNSNSYDIQLRIAKDFKFMSDEMKNYIGIDMIKIFKLLNEYSNMETSSNKLNLDYQLQQIVSNVTSSNFWSFNPNETIQTWINDNSKGDLKNICEHIRLVLSNESDLQNFIYTLIDENTTVDYHFTTILKTYRSTSLIVYYDDTLGYQPQEMIFEHYKILLYIYYDFILLIQNLNDLSETNMDAPNFVISIFQEFINIYDLFNKMSETIISLINKDENVIRYINMVKGCHIIFRNMFDQFIYYDIDDISDLKYLTFLLSDTHDIHYMNFDFPDINAITKEASEHRTSKIWLPINFNNLEFTHHKSSYSFAENLDIIRYRRLISDYLINNILNDM